MLLIRRFEEAAAEWYTKARIAGFLHLNIGEEATVVGSISALRPDDYLIDGYREHGHAIAKGVDPKLIMAELFGKEAGVSHGRGGSMHLFDAGRRFLGGYAIVGGSMPIAVGVGFAINYVGGNEIIMCLLGEGSTNIGGFHEAMNMSQLWKVPVVWVCVNNQYGMGTAVHRASAVREVWKKARAYDMKAVRVDGMDVLTVRAAADEAVRRAREEKLPTFIEAVTYRFRGHSMADPVRYRSREEVGEWRRRDPVYLFRDRLTEQGILDERTNRDVEATVDQIIAEAVQFAEQSPEPAPETLFRDVYAEGGE
ncbi:MAG: pyruvate dehydrogenase (acetyl-transferring) E1 component subunit alpha [Chloroflexi bacterium]|nr:pyruvate dehydrogenase (acetyl-transferring) E1 component subunit alpha [Chloroflexota bacterium]